MFLPNRIQAVTLASLVAAGTASVVLSTAAPAAFADVTCAKYASPTGSDTNSGTATSPYLTAQKLVNSLSSGQTACLNAGSYTGNVSIGMSGITLRSTPGQRATLLLDTLQINQGANEVTVSDLNIRGGGGALTMRPIGDHFQILRNDVTNNNGGMTCILVGAQSYTAHAGVIALNRIHNCGAAGNTLDHGIYAQNFAPDLTGGPGLTVEDNIFWGYAAYAVQLYPQGVGAVVDHNIMDASTVSVRGGVVIDGTVAQNDTIRNNVIYHVATAGIVQRTGSGHQALYNCFWENPTNISGSSITSVGNVTADPAFANLTGHDYTLSPGSTCLATVGYDTQTKLNAAWATEATATASPSPSATSSSTPIATASPTTVATDQPPTVSIVSPVAGSTVNNDLHAIANASDDHAVVKVGFLIDGKLFHTESTAPYDAWLSVRSLASGKHTFTAKAYDDAGLTASASVSFSRS